MFDRNIWNAIGNKKKCAYKLFTKTEILCKNKYNVTGICNEFSCPLANKRYATVRLEDDKLYLYIKTPETADIPNKMYEKIVLDYDYVKSLEQLEKRLEGWNEEVLHKCKQRLTKMFEYLERRIEFEKNPLPELVVKKKKMNRREKLRALKALNSATFEKDMSNEILMRLDEGILGEDVKEAYNDAKLKAKNRQKEKMYVPDLEESLEISDNVVSSRKAKNKKKKHKKDKNLNW